MNPSQNDSMELLEAVKAVALVFKENLSDDAALMHDLKNFADLKPYLPLETTRRDYVAVLENLRIKLLDVSSH